MIAESSAAGALGSPTAENTKPLTPRQRLRKAQECVYASAQSQVGLRCGDLVDVEWESQWYPGVITDIPQKDELAVAYTNGDFEESVPESAARLRNIPAKKKPQPQKSGKRDKQHTVKLSDAANAGDIGLVLQALREGSDPKGVDELGYTPLHWAAAPDEGMPGDTIARRACIAILGRLGDVNAKDRTTLGLRGVQHAVSRRIALRITARQLLSPPTHRTPLPLPLERLPHMCGWIGWRTRLVGCSCHTGLHGSWPRTRPAGPTRCGTGRNPLRGSLEKGAFGLCHISISLPEATAAA